MEPSILSLPRAARRRLMRVVHKTRDKDHARRALAILRLAEGLAVSEVARRLCAARSTVYRWWGRFPLRQDSCRLDSPITLGAER